MRYYKPILSLHPVCYIRSPKLTVLSHKGLKRVWFLLDLKSPVVGPARGAGMLAAGRHLSIVQVQLRFVRPLYEHPAAPCHALAVRLRRGLSRLGCSNKCTITCCCGPEEQEGTHGCASVYSLHFVISLL
jgi:hypothetical protein